MNKISKKLFKCNKKFKFHNNINKNRNGMIALDSLIGIVLSTIALVFVIQMIFNIFLNVPENQKISYSNAKSIVEFIDSSYEKYINYNNCYSMLKLSNLENFQFDGLDSKKNYFYIISKNKDKNEYGVSVILIDELSNVESQLEKGKGLDGIKIVKFFPFSEKNYDLKFDITHDDKFTFVLYGNKINDLSDNIEYSSDDIEYILLIPKLNEKFLGVDVKFVDADDNVLIGKTLVGDDLEYSEGFYLGFNPSERELFLTKSKYSNMFLKYNNCQTKENYKFNYDDYIKANPEKADYMNYKLVFDLVDEETGNRGNVNFIWNGGKISCPTQFNKGCEDYLGKNYENLNYIDFYEKIKGVEILKNPEFLSGSLSKFKLVEIKKLSIEDLLKIDRDNGHYDYDRVFVKLNVDNLNSKNVEDVLRAKFGEGNFYYDFLKYRQDKNECQLKYCDYIGFMKLTPYFYDYRLNDFVMFNTKLLRITKNGDVYFEGKKLDKKDKSFDDVGISWFKENYDFYLFNIDTEYGMRTIVLSDFLLNNMLIREDYKTSSQTIQESLNVPENTDTGEFGGLE